MEQQLISGFNSHMRIEEVLNELAVKRPLLVCDTSFEFLNIKNYFENSKISFVRFSGFSSNPKYDDVCRGVDIFRSEKCDGIVAVGGGSAIDVAKCIKLFSAMNPDENYLEQEKVDSDVKLIAVPTTAGTGSESTQFAVIYYKGIKQSITHKSIIPNYAILDCSVLKTLPLYQKKCTMADALCQGIESWWSVNSTDESKDYSQKAVKLILRNYEDYILKNSDIASGRIMEAANLSGRAINITQTTAPHAMSYKITSIYGIPHGHAVAICLPYVWKFMNDNLKLCVDKRGSEYLSKIFNDIAVAFGCNDVNQAINTFKNLLIQLDLNNPDGTNEEAKLLSESVNVTRLKNNPVKLNDKVLFKLYNEILNVKL